jgi:hypothetical protein
MNGFRFGFLCAALIAVHTAAAQGPNDSQRPSAEEVRRIAEGYAFAYPLVLLDLTRRSTLARQAMLGVGVNQFVHQRAFPDEHARLVIRPNADTFYSTAWLDLSAEPLLLHAPDTHDRYYVIQVLDAWTETTALPGKRSRGTQEGWFAIVGPGWRGALPAEVQRIDVPTNTAWLLGRTQVNGSADNDTVHAIQNGFALMPLHLYPDGGTAPDAKPPGAPNMLSADPPPNQVKRMTATQFFGAVASLLPQNPPHAQDSPMMKELERIGVAPGKPFDPESLGSEGRAALEQGVATAAAALQGAAAPVSLAATHGWSGFGTSVGRYGTHYDARANVAAQGLGALPPEEAVYFSCCQRSAAALDGAHAYTLHFAKGQLPPVRAFWSLTLYGEDGYFIANPIHRFAIGDRDALKFNADGSLDIYIQHDAPGAERDSNWLPAPEGAFNLTLRLYWPREQVASGHWVPPAITRPHLLGAER